MQRIGLFIAVNLLVVTAISILTSLLGFVNPPLILFCFFWGIFGSLISLLISKKMAKWMMGVQLVTLEGPHKSLVETVHRLSRRAGLTEMPEVGIYQSEILNAFATGPTRNNSLVAVSSQLMSTLSNDELEGVLGHEVAHIANGDMVTMALVQGVVNAFVMFASRVVAFMISQALRNNDNDRDQRPNPFITMMLVMLLDVVFGILASPIVAWFSRYREFRADRGGADLVGKEKMISALMAIERAYPQLEMNANNDNPNFKSMQITSKQSFLELFSSHPPIHMRIDALKRN